jgi:guanidinopropionase
MRAFSRAIAAPAYTAPRYTGIASFMRSAIVTEQAALEHHFADGGICMFGVPFDGGVTNRPGARHGPREVRNASSLMRAVHPTSRINVFESCAIADAGDVPFREPFVTRSCHDDTQAFASKLLRAGAIPLAVGGDHSISLPLLRAVCETQDVPVGLIHFDAHTDTWDSQWGEDNHHGAPFRRALEEGLIDPKRVVQVGIRGAHNFPGGWDYSEQAGFTVLPMHECERMSSDEIVAKIRAVVGDTPTYLTFDIDCIDPAFAPGTGTPECGGFSSREAIAMLRGLRGLSLVGADVVEVSPPYDVGAPATGGGLTALAGATVLYEQLALLAALRQ